MIAIESAGIASICASVIGAVVGEIVAVGTYVWPQVGTGATAQPDDQPPVTRPVPLVPGSTDDLRRGMAWFRQQRHADKQRRRLIVAASAAIAALSLLVSPGVAGMSGAIFGWMLLTLLVLDVEHFWLPDRLSMPLAVLGLLAGLWLPPSLSDRLLGCLAGFASLAAIAQAYKSMTGRTGLGGGDPRLFAGIGAWLGWAMLPSVLLLSSLLGLTLVGYYRLSGRAVSRYSRVPLGAFLAAAAWIVWLSSQIVQSGRWL